MLKMIPNYMDQQAIVYSVLIPVISAGVYFYAWGFNFLWKFYVGY